MAPQHAAGCAHASRKDSLAAEFPRLALRRIPSGKHMQINTWRAAQLANQLRRIHAGPGGISASQRVVPGHAQASAVHGCVRIDPRTSDPASWDARLIIERSLSANRIDSRRVESANV